MRVLLTANASYAPPKGGSTRSNLIWLRHLASQGHACVVVCPADGTDPESATVVDGIEIRTVRDLSRRTEVLAQHVREFAPDWVLVSSEDVAHTLLRAAYAAAPDRLVYLAHTPQWYPFGPASWHPDRSATDIIRKARAVVAIGKTTAAYIQEHAGVGAEVIHPPMYGTPPWPRFGSFDRGYVLMINPSVVKGIRIFLELAKRFPQIEFAGLAGWGTTSADRAAMTALPNVRILESVPNIDDALAGARLLLMPSVWFEGFGLIAMEAMLRGLPVVASDAGGLVEAKSGTGFVLPVRQVVRFEAAFDETHMPKPVEVPQNIAPWDIALRTLLTDRAAWENESARSREAAEHFVASLDAADLERLLLRLSERKLRVLLAHNSLYYPSHGGGDKSNRLLMEALAAQGHQVRVVSRVAAFGEPDGDKLLADLAERDVHGVRGESGIVRFTLHGVDVRTVAYESNLRVVFAGQIAAFDPDVIITSTDDPGQLLFDLAIKAPRARVVYLIRATIAVPFGPDASGPSPAKTEMLRNADAVIGVSEYVARYAREFGGLTDALHVPISLLDPGPEPEFLGRFENEYITLANPCAVKGISIFLELADRFPQLRFAAVPTWGTNPDDYAALKERPSVEILPPVDDIDDLLRRTRVLLVPSVWAEARSRIVLEAMARGVPVISSNAGGLPEAHMGVEYVLPVNVIRQYRHTLDMNMVPVADVPPQDIGVWAAALERLTSERAHWHDVAQRSRDAALNYARNLTVEPFEAQLRHALRRPKTAAPKFELSDDKKKLLALRLKQRAAPALLAGAELLKPGDLPLVCLPWAGGGTLQYLRWRAALNGVAMPVAVRLPGRESRLKEPPLESMDAILDVLEPAVKKLGRFALFGHSMGGGIAFELARRIRPELLIVSAARAPQYRMRPSTAPEPTDAELIDQIRAHGGQLPEQGLDLLLPALRADTRLYRQWVFAGGEPLDVPIVACGGADDPSVHREHIEGWSEQTTAEFVAHEFPGGHFYLSSAESQFLVTLRNHLAPRLR
ncbi:MAG: glycosyltransferase [Bryobacteraceae bacterium]|nr:glycosyltransferase [Bryobacteraceae bacterium]